VNFSPAFKWFLAILLPLTLAWKLVADVGVAEPPSPKNKIIELLAQHHYQVASRNDVLSKMLVIRGTRGSCSLLVAQISAMGGDRDYFRHLAGGGAANMFIVFQGKIYPQQAAWMTAFKEMWWRFLRKFGAAERAPVVLAVAATPACDAQHLPWNEVSR
jgi:hypothetical protein